MDEAEKYQQRLSAIAEKRRLQEEQERAKRQLEDEKLLFQQLKRKSLRDQWLMEGPPLSPNSAGPQSPLWGPKAQPLEQQIHTLLNKTQEKTDEHREDVLTSAEPQSQTHHHGNSKSVSAVTPPPSEPSVSEEEELQRVQQRVHHASLQISTDTGTRAETLIFLGYTEAEPGQGLCEDDKDSEVIRAERVIIADDGEEVKMKTEQDAQEEEEERTVEEIQDEEERGEEEVQDEEKRGAEVEVQDQEERGEEEVQDQEESGVEAEVQDQEERGEKEVQDQKERDVEEVQDEEERGVEVQDEEEEIEGEDVGEKEGGEKQEENHVNLSEGDSDTKAGEKSQIINGKEMNPDVVLESTADCTVLRNTDAAETELTADEHLADSLEDRHVIDEVLETMTAQQSHMESPEGAVLTSHTPCTINSTSSDPNPNGTQKPHDPLPSGNTQFQEIPLGGAAVEEEALLRTKAGVDPLMDAAGPPNQQDSKTARCQCCVLM